jgi:hypothetical protein
LDKNRTGKAFQFYKDPLRSFQLHRIYASTDDEAEIRVGTFVLFNGSKKN